VSARKRSAKKRSARTRPAYHHGDLARALVDAAIEIVAERGVESLTLSEAARRVGVTHAAVYRHFADKRALLVAVADRGFARLSDVMDAATRSAPPAPRDAFLHVGRAIIRFAVSEPVLYRVTFSGHKRASLVELAGAPAFSPFGRLLTFVGELQKAGLLRSGEALPHALAIWSATHGLAMLAISGDLPSSRATLGKLADAVHASLLDGLAASP
jgi:AcrR family transcriptional regulator